MASPRVSPRLRKCPLGCPFVAAGHHHAHAAIEQLTRRLQSYPAVRTRDDSNPAHPDVIVRRYLSSRL
jgi:hypothetical protein